MSKKRLGEPGGRNWSSLQAMRLVGFALLGCIVCSSVVVGQASPASRLAETLPATQPVKLDTSATKPVDSGSSMPLPASKEPGNSPLNWNDTNSPNLTGTTLYASLVVIIVGGVALIVVKRILPRLTGRGLTGAFGGGKNKKQMCVLETTYLGPRKALHLVEVSGRKLLLAGCGDQIKLLADVTVEPILNAESEDASADREETVA